jgi:hypothetical protein
MISRFVLITISCVVQVRLHRKGVGVEHIMRLGGWETLDMVVRYTKSVKFEDSLKMYEEANPGLFITGNSRGWYPPASAISNLG